MVILAVLKMSENSITNYVIWIWWYLKNLHLMGKFLVLILYSSDTDFPLHWPMDT